MKEKKLWAVVHWLGKIHSIGTERDCKRWVKANGKLENAKSPIYYALPVDGKVAEHTCDKCGGEGKLLVLVN